MAKESKIRCNWTRGRGLLGPLKPLVGTWATDQRIDVAGPSAMLCRRRFEPFGKSWLRLDASWIVGPDKVYREIAIFGATDDGGLGFFSFTNDGKRSAGVSCDASDVALDAIAFETKMPAGTARMIYWPLESGPGFQFAVESRNKKGWHRFLTQRFVPASAEHET